MLTHTLGFPRIGAARELKKALETYWALPDIGREQGREDLLAAARALRLRHWTDQVRAGVDIAPVGDFSLYDHVLDQAVRLGATPARFGRPQEVRANPDLYFRLARGGGRPSVAPLEMTKWFDTNYHFLAPELAPDQTFDPDAGDLLAQLAEARAAGFRTKAVLVGPCTFLFCAKCAGAEFDRFTLLPALVEAYVALLRRLADATEWIQIDEPVLGFDLPHTLPRRFRAALARLVEAARPARLMLATYFGGVAHNVDVLSGLPLGALHVDLVRAPDQLDAVIPHLAAETMLSLGVVDGRNVWRVDADRALKLIAHAAAAIGTDRLLLAPSCSLLHCPLTLDAETDLAPEVRSRMAFALQKCAELRRLADCAADRTGSRDPSCAEWLAEGRRLRAKREHDPRLRDPAVRDRLARATPDMLVRPPYAERREIQRKRLHLPLLPTTTIGSFPQTAEVRSARAKFRRGELSPAAYRAFLRDTIRETVVAQERLGLDVLVHGECERNDMVEYFGERLQGFAFTKNGWVQSYGSRCVKPPVIVGDVARPAPMTVEWAAYAQSLTKRPMKGMLTGPVTILNWSFVRDDQPRFATCRQIALALRDEVRDLAAAGLPAIQIDEPALREGLPLRRSDRENYLRQAVDAFRLVAGVAGPETQIHTHMCYCEFNDILPWIAALDADVISIEASRSRMELLSAFRDFRYPNEVGPGVYDIHSPRVPSVEEMLGLLRRAAAVIPVDRLWANPDCGLKTRAWPEVLASLTNMVEAAGRARAELAPAGRK